MGGEKKKSEACHIEGNDLSGRLHHVTTIMITDAGAVA